MTPPPKGQPQPEPSDFCAAHEHIDRTLTKVDAKLEEFSKQLTDIRIALARVEEVDARVVTVSGQVTDLRVELAHYDESNRGAWKELRTLREAWDRKRDRDDEPTGVRDERDREDNTRSRKRDREDRERSSIGPNGGGAVFKIPVPKIIVWIAIAIGIAIAAGGWAWGVLRDQSGATSAVTRPAIRDPLALPAPPVARTSTASR